MFGCVLELPWPRVAQGCCCMLSAQAGKKIAVYSVNGDVCYMYRSLLRSGCERVAQSETT